MGKTRNLQKRLKITLVAIAMLSMGAVSAQRTESTTEDTDFTKQGNTTLGASTGSVKVIDNKGTIKYLQSSNGITMLTNKTPAGGVVTTWQLGGTLTDDTTITATEDATFAIAGIAEIDPTDTEALTVAGNTAATEFDGTGYTLMVRDEVTGEVKKMLATDLITGILVDHVQDENATANVDITVEGLPALDASTTMAKLFVYRNGAKLRAKTDFTVTANTVTITYNATDLPMYAGDIVEVQYVK